MPDNHCIYVSWADHKLSSNETEWIFRYISLFFVFLRMRTATVRITHCPAVVGSCWVSN